MKWIDGVPYWSHGNKPTTNANVAAIVCKHARPRDGKVCANPCGGDTSGATDTWESRLASAQQLEASLQRVVETEETEGGIYERYSSIFEEFGQDGGNHGA